MGVCILYKKNIEVIENKKEYENENNYDKKKKRIKKIILG